jgi:general secretion pathway protein N
MLIAIGLLALASLGAGPIAPPSPETVARYAVITQRDLFRPERREPPPPPPPPPPVAAPAPPPPPPPPPPQVVLEGVAIFPTDQIRVALISEPSLTQGKAKDFRQGETLGGWTIAEILADKIVLRQGERSAEIKMKKPASPTSTARGPGAPAAPGPGGRLPSPSGAPPSQSIRPPSPQAPARGISPSVQPPAWTPPRR